MKISATFYAVAAMLLSVLFIDIITRAADANLISNPSVETMNATSQPSGWTQDAWGNNTSALKYTTSGYGSSRGLRAEMTQRVDGDAKWMHDSVAIQSKTDYTYASWYKANVATEIDVKYEDANGNVSYEYVATVSPSTEWQRISVKFTTPATAVKVTVMHMLVTPGWLETDDFSLSQAVATPNSDGNLFSNASFELANGTNPSDWNQNKWGDNAPVFSYESTGRTGTKSAKVTMSKLVSGDAKWYSNLVTVTPGQAYNYNDFYKASVSTRVVAAFVDADGVFSYTELPTAPASATNWTQYSAGIVAPVSATHVTIFHLIDSVGSLTLDDVSLSKAPTTPATIVPNPSLETAQGSMPANWQSGSWGSNTALFNYMTEGRTGSRSAKVTVSNYVDGDAKWQYGPVVLKPGSQYRFTTWYKTNATPRAVVMFNMTDGTTRYAGMPISRPGSNAATVWQKYSDTFMVPAGTASVSTFLFLNQNGWLQTDDYSLEAYSPTGYSRPLVTLTFDDGHEDNYASVLPVVKQYGYKTTQCFATDHIEGQPAATTNKVLAFSKAGHEICSHTVTHPFMTTLTSTKLSYEASHSQQYLRQFTGQQVRNFATPYGDYNVGVLDVLKKYYRSHRSVDEGFNSKDNFDIYNIRVQNILDTTTPTQVAAWLAQAKAEKTWLVLVYHRVANDPGPYDTTPSKFKGQLDAIKASGITVKTYNAALDEVVAQP